MKVTYIEIIEDITRRHPSLSLYGFGKDDHEWISPSNEEAFWAAVQYAQTLRVSKGYPTRFAATSYGLKHDVEAIGTAKGQHLYCANGIMIAALIYAEIPFKLCRDGINAVPHIAASSRFSPMDRQGRRKIDWRIAA